MIVGHSIGASGTDTFAPTLMPTLRFDAETVVRAACVALTGLLWLFLIPDLPYLLELARALLVQWMGLALLLVVVAFWYTHWVWAALLIVPVAWHGQQQVRFMPFQADESVCPTGPQLTAVQANLWHDNPEWPEAVALLARADADFLSVQELNSAWMHVADSLLDSAWPFSHVLSDDTCCYGLGIWSRHRLQSAEVYHWGDAPTLRAVAVTPIGKVVVYSVHTRPPVFPDETAQRDQMLDSLAVSIRNELYPVIVLGDLNIVPWDPTYQRFLSRSKLTDTRNGFHPTYPLDLRLPLIPIDHIATTQLRSCGFGSFHIPGSDHRGVVVQVGTM